MTGLGLGLGLDGVGDEHGLQDLVGDLAHGGGRVGQKQCVGLVAFADGLQGVEVLRHQDQLHDLL
jgi:hypothetical protein